MIDRQLAEAEPEAALGETLDRYLQDALDAFADLSRELRAAGGRDSANPLVAHFSRLHMANLDALGPNGERLEGPYLVNALRDLKEGKA